MKNYEANLLKKQGWGLGFWVLPGWFGIQLGGIKLVVSKKREPIEPIESMEAQMIGNSSYRPEKIRESIIRAFRLKL